MEYIYIHLLMKQYHLAPWIDASLDSNVALTYHLTTIQKTSKTVFCHSFQSMRGFKWWKLRWTLTQAAGMSTQSIFCCLEWLVKRENARNAQDPGSV